MRAIIRMLCVLNLAMICSSCGGGGGGSAPAPVIPPPSNQAPTANAGTDQSVDEGTTVDLSATGADGDGTIASYNWQQESGTTVTISNADMANASFVAPIVAASEVLVLRVTVTDDDGATGSDTVSITVNDTPPQPGSVISVNTTDDELNADGDCSLREAIRAANTNSVIDACTAGTGADDIVFDALVVPGTFALSIAGVGEEAALTGDLDITDDLTITGGGAGNTIIDGSGLDRVFETIDAITFNLTGLTVQGGVAANEFAGGIQNRNGTVTISDSVVRDNVAWAGGGIDNDGTMVITNSTIIDNTADSGGGGGIDNDGTITIINSTIAGNFAEGNAGGIFAFGTMTIINTTIANNTARTSIGGGISTGGGGSFTVNNSTISGNTASGGGGGIAHETGTLELQNTIVAGNSDPNSPDCSGSITSLGNNLIGDTTSCGIVLVPITDLTGDPGLDALIDDGTPGEGFFPLLPGSQAIDTGDDSTCPSTDQLGTLRPQDGDGDGMAICDIGAYEF